MKILYAEDEAAMSKAVCCYLSRHDCEVDAVYDGEDALAYAASNYYSCIILDIVMPKIDGLSVLKKLREAGNYTPILILAAKSEVEYRIDALNAGADDYLCKPFVMGELLARIYAMVRRRDTYIPDAISYGNVRLDLARRSLCNEDDAVHLGKLEYRLMKLFMRNPQIVFSSEMLLTHIWGTDSQAHTDSVWVYISYLRKKLEALHANIEIRSRRGVGYSLEMKDE